MKTFHEKAIYHKVNCRNLGLLCAEDSRSLIWPNHTGIHLLLMKTTRALVCGIIKILLMGLLNCRQQSRKLIISQKFLLRGISFRLRKAVIAVSHCHSVSGYNDLKAAMHYILAVLPVRERHAAAKRSTAYG